MTPNMLPPTVIAKMIHSGFMPVESPRIFGPRTEHHDREDQSLDWLDEQQDQNTRDGTDKRSEIRDHICNAYDDTDQQSIWEPQDRHQYEAEHTDDGGVNKFPDDEAAEQPVALCQNLMAGIKMLLREKP